MLSLIFITCCIAGPLSTIWLLSVSYIISDYGPPKFKCFEIPIFVGIVLGDARAPTGARLSPCFKATVKTCFIFQGLPPLFNIKPFFSTSVIVGSARYWFQLIHLQSVGFWLYPRNSPLSVLCYPWRCSFSFWVFPSILWQHMLQNLSHACFLRMARCPLLFSKGLIFIQVRAIDQVRAINYNIGVAFNKFD